MRHASALVRAGRAAPRDFRFFSGFCAWRPGQLERDVAARRWLPVAASVDVLRNMLAGGVSSWDYVCDGAECPLHTLHWELYDRAGGCKSRLRTG